MLSHSRSHSGISAAFHGFQYTCVYIEVDVYQSTTCLQACCIPRVQAWRRWVSPPAFSLWSMCTFLSYFVISSLAYSQHRWGCLPYRWQGNLTNIAVLLCPVYFSSPERVTRMLRPASTVALWKYGKIYTEATWDKRILLVKVYYYFLLALFFAWIFGYTCWLFEYISVYNSATFQKLSTSATSVFRIIKVTLRDSKPFIRIVSKIYSKCTTWKD